MNKFVTSLLLIASSLAVSAASSILTLKNSITDNSIIYPESFETDTHKMMQNWYLKNYAVLNDSYAKTPVVNATDEEYIKRLSSMPTEIEMPYNQVVRSYINMYVQRRRDLVESMLGMSLYYMPIFEQALERKGLPLELRYLPVIESALNPDAVSRAGATGLWQFMLPTARGLGLEINTLVDERRDPYASSEAAATYLKQLYDMYNDWSLAIAAYNCGPGNVNKALRRASGDSEEIKDEKKDFWEIYNYLPAETRGYVPAFIAANYVMNYYRQHGISPTIVKRHLTTDTVRIDKNVHFNQIASVLNIPVEEIRMLNPQFLKDQIPGAYRPYYLTLPTQQCLSYIMSEKRILDYDKDLYARRTTAEPGGSAGESSIITSDGGKANLANASRQSDNAETNHEIATQATERTVTKIHEVQRGENLRDIAKMYAVSATDIKRWNKLRAGKVKEGDRLTIEVVEHITPDEVHVVAAPEVAQVFPKDNTDTSAEAKADSKAETTETKAAPAKPKENTQRTKATHTTTHKVKKGDTLDRIARKYGTTVAAIQAANGMQKNNTRIQIGQRLKIPAKGSAASTTKKSTAKKSTKRKAARPRK